MDAISFFRSQFPNIELKSIDGVWYALNGQNLLPLENCSKYLRIKRCVEKHKDTDAFFECSCGCCNAYLMQQMYKQMKAAPAPAPTESSLPSLSTFLTQVCNDICQTITEPPIVHPLNVPAKPAKLIGFGKYAGETYEHVFKNDRKYCIWCIESAAQDKLTGKASPVFLEFVQWCKEKILSM